MPKVGEAYYDLTARDAGLVSALAKAEGRIASGGASAEKNFGGSVVKGVTEAETAVAGGTVRMGASLGKMGGATEKLTSTVGNLKTGLVQGLGIGGFMAVSSAAGMFIAQVTQSVQLASNLNETIQKSSVTFGASAADILAWSKTTSSTMGLSQQAALDYSATFGGLLSNFGILPEKVAPMSKSLVQLAADMASFSNSSPEEALMAIQSGLVGETEPLRRFQVNLSQARIEAKAMADGLWDGKGAIDTAAKAQATYALILQDSSRQQGDFARTSSGLANTQRTDAAKSAEAWTAFGAALLPIANVIIPAISQAGTGLINFLTTLLTHGREIVPILTILGGVVATFVVPPFIAWAAATLAATWPIIAVVAVVGGAIAIFNQLGLLGPFLDAFWNDVSVGAKLVGDVIGAVFEVIKFVVGGIIGTIRNVVSIAADIPGPWQEAARGMKASLQAMQGDVEAWGKSTGVSAGKAADDIVGGVAGGLAAGAPAVKEGADKGIKDPIIDATHQGRVGAVAAARETPGAIASSIAAGRDAVASGADTLKQAFADHISPMKEIAQLQGDLTGKMMKKGLSSNDPIIKGAAQQWRSDIQDRLYTLQNGVGQYALATGKNYGDALDSKKAAIRKVAADQAVAVAIAYAAQQGTAKVAGEEVGKAFATGIGNEGTYLHGIVSNYLLNATKQLKGQSPPPEGPLHTIDVDARRVAQNYADSFATQGAYFGSAVTSFLGRGLQPDSTFSAGPPIPTGAIEQAIRPGSSQTVTIGDVIVPVTFAGPAPTSPAGIRELGRSLGEEVRLALVRTPDLFPVRGG